MPDTKLDLISMDYPEAGKPTVDDGYAARIAFAKDKARAFLQTFQASGQKYTRHNDAVRAVAVALAALPDRVPGATNPGIHLTDEEISVLINEEMERRKTAAGWKTLPPKTEALSVDPIVAVGEIGEIVVDR